MTLAAKKGISTESENKWRDQVTKYLLRLWLGRRGRQDDYTLCEREGGSGFESQPRTMGEGFDRSADRVRRSETLSSWSH